MVSSLIPSMKGSNSISVHHFYIFKKDAFYNNVQIVTLFSLYNINKTELALSSSKFRG
jgi:hypothetical protein